MAVKTEIIPLRVTPLMKEKVEKAAEENQENLAEWIRKAIEMRLEKESK